MKVVINLYKRHMATVDNYITTAIKNAPKDYIEHADEILKQYTFFQLLYSVDEEYRQISPAICRKQRENINVGSDKSHYFTKLELDEDGFYISNPYIHYRTGRASITVVRKMEGTYYVFDCDLITVLYDLLGKVKDRYPQGRGNDRFKNIMQKVCIPVPEGHDEFVSAIEKECKRYRNQES